MPELIDYETMAEAELAKATEATAPAVRRAHLDQASVFATLAERQRAMPIVMECDTEACRR